MHQPPSPTDIFLRNTAVIVAYCVFMALSFAGAYLLRFDFNVPGAYQNELFRLLPYILASDLALLLLCGQFSSMLTFFSVPDLMRILTANGIWTGLGFIGWYASRADFFPPRSVLLITALLNIAGLCTFRFVLRRLREHTFNKADHPNYRMEPVAIIGAGETGANLANILSTHPRFGLNPIAFIDNDHSKWGIRIHGVPVKGDLSWLLGPDAPNTLKRVIIAMPSAAPAYIAAIVEQLEGQGMHLETVPSIKDLLAGKYQVSKLRPLSIEDILGREPAELNSANICSMLAGRVVAVTGAGGSIGSELCRQIAQFHPSKLLLIERSEAALFAIEQELLTQSHTATIVPLVADTTDHSRMVEILEDHHPALLFHAAAHKHVPMMESQPSEAIRNNALATAQLARLAHQYAVERLVLISSDKAIHPTNVMGATKRIAELFLQAFQHHHRDATRFMSVRFGNVLGSSGSVVPIFEKQIAAGGPLTLTHRDITRYFMTIPEAVGLVLQSATMGKGGEIFLLDMGQPVKILDLAKQMILLHGLKPDTDIAIHFTGLRPGEKMYEELNYSVASCQPTDHPKVFRLTTAAPDLATIVAMLSRLEPMLNRASADALKMQLAAVLPEYTPQLGLVPLSRSNNNGTSATPELKPGLTN